jgi:hypothetical protein
MPDLGTSAYAVLETIFTLARSLVNDAAGNWATDAVLLPYANAAYRTVNSELGNVQAASYIKDNVLMVLPAVAAIDPTVQVLLNDAGFNNGTTNFTKYSSVVLQLPPDLLVPLKLWERTPGSTEDFVEMEDVTDGGGLPSELQDQRLRYWEWRQDGIYMLGAIQDEQIRMRYEAAFLDMTDGTSPLLIRNGQNAVAFKTAELAGTARGAPGAALAKALYADEIELLKNRATQREQAVGRRRRPFSSRFRGRSLL